MEGDKAHSAVYPLGHKADGLVAYLIVSLMTPPYEDIGIVKKLLCDAIVFHIKGGVFYGDIIVHFKIFSYLIMYSLWVYGCYLGLIFLVDIFVPDKHIYHL